MDRTEHAPTIRDLSVGRAATGVLLALSSASFVLFERHLRAVEAGLGARLGGLLAADSGPLRAEGASVHLWAGTPREAVVEVTALGSVTPYLAGGVFVVALVVVIDPTVRAVVVVRTAALVVAGLIAANAVRIAVIVLCIGRLGMERGYDLGARMLGTLLALSVLVLALWRLLAAMDTTPRRRVAGVE